MSDKTPVEAEAAGETTATIKNEALGVEFEIPRDIQEWPAGASYALERNRGMVMLEYLMPSSVFEHAMTLKTKQLRLIVDQVAETMGFGSAGESSASSD